jgi:hypothetical protein
MSKKVTLTVYLEVDDNERVDKWDIADALGEGVQGWDITEGHPVGCPGCNEEEN